MATNGAPFGFGQSATGAPAGTAPDEPKNIGQLVSVLQSLAVGSAPPHLVTIAAGEYDFQNQEFVIRAKRLTLQAQPKARVVLKDITLRLDPTSADQVLIQGLVFQSSGKGSDAIRLRPADDAKPNAGRVSVRIAFCSFDGYKDIAIDHRNSTSFPQFLATIDHCLFFDSMPGQPATPKKGEKKLPFVDRGAINFGSLEGPKKDGPQLPSNASVTVAENVFFEVWRRCPRVATSNFGHIFNNVVYRWGFGNDQDSKDNGTNSWRGIEIGGGDGVTGGGNNGSALIEANRFIPFKKKRGLAETITIKSGTVVDIGVTPSTSQPPVVNQPNRFDDPDANAQTVTFPPPPQGLSFIGSDRYTDVGLRQPKATPANSVNWISIVSSAGPFSASDPKTPEGNARQRLLDVLKAAGG